MSKRGAMPIGTSRLTQEAERLGQLLEKLQEERAALREDTRAAHEALKDLAHATAGAAALINQYAADEVGKLVSDHVKAGLAEYDGALKTAIDTATQAVYDRFDVIAAICLGEDYETRAEGLPPVEELIRRYVKSNRALASGETSIVSGKDDDLSAFVKPHVTPGNAF